MVAARAAAAPPAPPDPSTLGRGKRVRTTVLGPPHTPEQPKERSMLGLGKRARAIKPSGPVKSEQSCGSASGACPHPSMLGKGKGSRTNPGCSAKPRSPRTGPLWILCRRRAQWQGAPAAPGVKQAWLRRARL